MKPLRPKEPVRADHRFLKKVIDGTFSKEMEQVPEDFDKISRWFSKVGGSWERIFLGSPRDVVLLKKVIKVALKNNLLTKKQSWK
jgi:hypothetical protein